MMRVFRGEFFATHPHSSKPRISGFIASNPQLPVTIESVLEHILDSTQNTPFISVSTESSIAGRWAPAGQGAVYRIEASDDIEVIDPKSFIYNWLIEQDIWEGEFYLRAKEAIDMADNDHERLIVGYLPAKNIASISLT